MRQDSSSGGSGHDLPATRIAEARSYALLALNIAAMVLLFLRPLDAGAQSTCESMYGILLTYSMLPDAHAAYPAPPLSVLRFLDEDSTPWENLRLVSAPPAWPFLRAVF